MSEVPELKIENVLMRQFTGTKTVKACKMSRVAAEEILKRKIYNDDREDEPGYLVKYPDGYTSWSPAKAFEDAYRVSETYIDRMKIEQEEVSKRYLDDRKFTFTQKFRDLSEIERKMLLTQLNEMEAYLYTLGKRISYAEHAITPFPGSGESKSGSK